jgi:tRNA(His) guanylyltransferase
MSDSTSLGDRMKRYEAVTQSALPRRTYTVIRVDIRAAHVYLRAADRPFDYEFMADMDATAEAMCAEISGAVLAYAQSDEISILATDFDSHGTEPWLDRKSVV